MIDIKDLIKSRYAQDSDLKKSFDMPDSISKRILRKSCRKFKKSKVSKEILISLIASAQAAPSKSNLQQYSILLIKFCIASEASITAFIKQSILLFLYS